MTRKPVDDIAEAFRLRFRRSPEWIVAAPGRVNLIGEHTDYNDGFVLPMAIDKYTVIAASRRDGREPAAVNAFSASLDDGAEFAVAMSSLEPTGSWTDYIKGVLAEFLERGLAAPSLDLLVHSDVPMGCGLSSSAALQVATARLLAQLGTTAVADDDIAALCQAAEHRFAGVPVGIMDPYCIANARSGHLVYLDCRTLQAEHIAFDDPDVTVLVIDSRVSRELRSGAYAERRAQCEQACRVMGVDKLRDVSLKQVAAARKTLGDVCFRRARHVTTENARTVAAVAAIRDKDWERFGTLMYESHDSLRDDFEVSCVELDVLVGLARKIGTRNGVLGARMTGGGFGGCVVALIAAAKATSIIDKFSDGYRRATGRTLAAYVSPPAPGARLLDPHEPEAS